MSVYVAQRDPVDGGYDVRDQETHDLVGRILPVTPPPIDHGSRRARGTWWQAVDLTGQMVGEPHARQRDAAAELDR